MKSKLPKNPRIGYNNISDTLLKQARKEGNIVYGAQAIKKRLGINSRTTRDYDFYSKMPKKSALNSEKTLDRLSKKDVFFTKKGLNKTTYKVKYKGVDGKANTKDDIGIADYTQTPKKLPKTFTFRGVRYRSLREELKAKTKLLKDKSYKFRRQKDLDDVRRIRKFGKQYL